MRRMLLSAGLCAGLVALIGCGQTTTSPSGKDGPVAKADPKPDNKHASWWCNEHGVPEDECSMCSKKAAKDFKAKGDWCEKHDRAKSQCFICDASLMAKYAAKYEAKFGKAPPEPEDNMPEKKDEKKDKK